MKFIKNCLLILLIASLQKVSGQVDSVQPFPTLRDSITVRVHSKYNDVGKIHRILFGENYRKDWAMPVKLPVIRLSELFGGLKPIREGGGMESKTLRLRDPAGKEWVLRSVEKTPEKLLPDNFQGTFVVDWIDDELSGQHPFSALIVPPLAQAAKVPHADPVIGVVAADTILGKYNKVFKGMVCLLEQREPAGPSENSQKMVDDLKRDHKNRLDAELFLRARMLDLLLGDWDRHEDQWRWKVNKTSAGKEYVAVPRDRDQVFHVTQGVFPSIASLPWLDPVLENFDGEIPSVKYSMFKTRFLKNFSDPQLSYNDWTRIVDEFVQSETDNVFEAALKRLPVEDYRLRHDMLMEKLKKRRGNIAAAMSRYYLFINRIVDIQATDAREQITLTSTPDKALRVKIQGITASGQFSGLLMDRVFDPDTTSELRIYTRGGDDQIVVDNKNSPVKVRFVDSTGKKSFEIKHSPVPLRLYGLHESINLIDPHHKMRDLTQKNNAAGKFIPTNLYNIWMPLVNAGGNADDGFLLGLGVRYTGVDGFRKVPYSTRQSLMITHSFSTEAFRVKYDGEWLQVIGKTDLVLQALLQAPDNTMNFFGRGNNTILNKDGDFHRFYRARFDLYQFDAGFRWKLGLGTTFTAGPSFQQYHTDPDANIGRFINEPNLIHNYDSVSVNRNKAHLGVTLKLESDKRSNKVLPTGGYQFSLKVQEYFGLDSYAKSFVQILPEFTIYQKLNGNGSVVLSDRIGGGLTIGKPAFYQSLFLGGQGNLLGYLQNRFSGQNMLYNNLQMRVKIGDIASYIVPGQIGLTGFFDTGRVWVSKEQSSTWHLGTGGGIYFAPAGLTVVQFLAGHSSEGWYPYIALNFRM